GLLAGAAGAAVALLTARLLRRPEAAAAAVWLALAPGASALFALVRRPDLWTAARSADELGLLARATSALHAARIEHPAARPLGDFSGRRPGAAREGGGGGDQPGRGRAGPRAGRPRRGACAGVGPGAHRRARLPRGLCGPPRARRARRSLAGASRPGRSRPRP